MADSTFANCVFFFFLFTTSSWVLFFLSYGFFCHNFKEALFKKCMASAIFGTSWRSDWQRHDKALWIKSLQARTQCLLWTVRNFV